MSRRCRRGTLYYVEARNAHDAGTQWDFWPGTSRADVRASVRREYPGTTKIGVLILQPPRGKRAKRHRAERLSVGDRDFRATLWQLARARGRVCDFNRCKRPPVRDVYVHCAMMHLCHDHAEVAIREDHGLEATREGGA